LEAIEDIGSSLGDLFAIFTAPYGTSMSGMAYHLAKHRRRREAARARAELARDEHRAFIELMYRLRRDELVQEKRSRRGISVMRTEKGKRKLAALRERLARSLPEARYAAEKEATLKIVLFDIPERERSKRDWLRSVLARLKFSMLQKSVWIGKTKIPEEFIQDLRRLKILPYIEIIAVTKTGSLKPIYIE